MAMFDPLSEEWPRRWQRNLMFGGQSEVGAKSVHIRTRVIIDRHMQVTRTDHVSNRVGLASL